MKNPLEVGRGGKGNREQPRLGEEHSGSMSQAASALDEKSSGASPSDVPSEKALRRECTAAAPDFAGGVGVKLKESARICTSIWLLEKVGGVPVWWAIFAKRILWK